MIDGIGVCSVCAKVCHADHDVTFSKFGSFFCDCGAKEDGTCQAMTKRTLVAQKDDRKPASYGFDSLLPSSMRRRTESPPAAEAEASSSSKQQDAVRAQRLALAQKLSPFHDGFVCKVNQSDLVKDLMHTMYTVLPVIKANGEKYSSVGRLAKIQSALERLHAERKLCDQTDQLMLPTLGSQEGAFENVRMNYSGDQGQTCLLYTSPSPRDLSTARMPSSA